MRPLYLGRRWLAIRRGWFFLSENMITRENNKYKNQECKRETESNRKRDARRTLHSLYRDSTRCHSHSSRITFYFSSTMDMHYGERQAQRAVTSGGGRVRISVLPEMRAQAIVAPHATCHRIIHPTRSRVLGLSPLPPYCNLGY